jgi:hypothetical protein
MSLLVRDGATIRLEDHWPTPDDLGVLVIHPGGAAGILTSWWHAPTTASGAGSSSSPTTRQHPRPV